MSRQSTAAQRNLTLTEELEKLEQSITLTLQEIDHNFSRAHRIVTTSILPIVDQYAERSKYVWEGSKFWKQFFEASANVSLSGYEESPAEDETVTEDTTSGTTPSTSTYGSPPQAHDAMLTPQTNGRAYADDYLSPSPFQETPRPAAKSTKTPTQKRSQPTTAPYSSPYESLKRDILPSAQVSPSESELPSTPRAQNISPMRQDDPQSSPFAPPSTAAHTARRTPANDLLLHRVLDKNWRVQATPHSTARLPYRNGPQPTPMSNTAKQSRHAAPNDDLDSSPVIAAPELHAEIFDSPARRGRVPGVSILTPAKGWREGVGQSDHSAKQEGGAATKDGDNLWDSDSDGEEGAVAGMSPPKTMQFHVPQARLMRTPAREASKRIVEDLLLTAGGNVSEDFEDDSPSVVKRGGLLEEDTF